MVKHTLKILRCSHTARFLKYVWPFYNIMHERVNLMVSQVDFCHLDQPQVRKVKLCTEEIKTALVKVSVRAHISPEKARKAARDFQKNFMVTITIFRIKKTTLNKMRTTLIMLTYFQLK